MNDFARCTKKDSQFPSNFEFILPIGCRDEALQEQCRRASPSNNIAAEEQPLWVEELLDELETDQVMPMARKGHQRSLSDSLACMDIALEEKKNTTGTQCAKQKLAQRSRIRKVHYIAELERNVQALQAEGSKVSAALNFLDQQNLILGMQNQALKQRLDSLSQERFIKFLEQDMLEKELGRLRVIYQLQIQNQQQKHLSRRQTKSRGLEPQFSTVSMQNKEARS